MKKDSLDIIFHWQPQWMKRQEEDASRIIYVEFLTQDIL